MRITMPSRFALDTAVTRVDDRRYAVRIDRGWWVVRGPNGGYLAALILRAITTDVADPARRPRSFTVHYLRPPREGDVELVVQPERVGRTTTVATARMMQDGKLTALAMAALGTDRPGPEFAHLVPPTVAAPGEIAPSRGPVAIPMRERYEMRIALGRPPWEEAPAAAAVTGGWIRLTDPEPLDAHVIAALTDAWFPAVFTVTRERVQVPTVDLTIHFRDAPAPVHDWCLVRFVSRHASHGFVEEDGEIWSRDGRLLAQSRQLALMSIADGGDHPST
jgi:acyl-CoA thioesterase